MTEAAAVATVNLEFYVAFGHEAVVRSPAATRRRPQTSNCAVRSVQARIKHERSGRTLSWLRTRLAFAEHLPDSSSEANLEHRSPLCKDFAVRTRSPALVIQKWAETAWRSASRSIQ